MSVKFTDNSKEVLKAFDEQAETALELIGSQAERYAKQDCPVDTGLLRNSISHAIDDNNDVYIGTNVKYASYVEYNDTATHTTGKAHFLRDAATTHGDEYKRIFERVMKS